MAAVQGVWLTYKAYRPSIPNVSSVKYGPMYALNFLGEVYDLYRAYG